GRKADFMRNTTAGVFVLIATIVGCGGASNGAPSADDDHAELADPTDVASKEQAVDSSLSGLAVWAKSLDPVPIRVASDGAGNAWRPTEVRIAPDGDVVTLGHGDGVVDFGATSFTADAQLVVARFDASGSFEWARMFGEARAGNRRGLQVEHDLELDGAGGIYFIGVHFATIDFGGGTIAAPP